MEFWKVWTYLMVIQNVALQFSAPKISFNTFFISGGWRNYTQPLKKRFFLPSWFLRLLKNILNKRAIQWIVTIIYYLLTHMFCFFMCAGNNYLGNFVVFGIFYVRFSPVEVTISQKNGIGKISDLTSRPEKNGVFQL